MHDALNPDLDIDRLRAVFAEHKRVQIRGFLRPNFARTLKDELAALPWRTVLNENGKHIDIHPLQVKQLGPKRMRLIREAAAERSRSEFQYLYQNFPVFDILQSGNPVPGIVETIYDAMNSKGTRDLLGRITGLSFDYCDMQATRYRKGHFLTAHDDDVDGKNRQAAYVMNLTPKWRQSWGGNLRFIGGDNETLDEFVPGFNVLNIFAVPQMHEVTKVRPAADQSRLALTGWYRQDG